MKKKIFSTLLLVAFALASTSMFVSCKDYDDDISKNAADISNLRAELEQRLADCKNRCDAEHARFLTEHQSLAGYAKLSDIPSLDGYATIAALEALQAELANYVKASEIEDALAYINALQEKGITADGLADLGVKVAAIDEALLKLLGVDDISKAAAAAENMKAQIDALNLYKEALEKENIDPDLLVTLLKKIKDFDTDIQKFPADDLTKEEVAKLKELLENADKLINMAKEGAGANINIIQYMIDKTLASLVLMPSDYVAGLATIEVPALYYQPVIGVADANTKDEAYYYFDNKGKFLYTNKNVIDWRFDDGDNAPSITLPTWDSGFGWSDEYSGYDFRGEGSDAKGNLVNNGEGTMLPIYRSVIEKFTDLKTAKLVPNAIAKYHVNPTTVKLDDYKLSFWTNTAVVTDEIESRNTGYLKSMANDFAAPVKENGADYAVNGGILEVPFKLNNWENYVEDLVYYFDGVAIKDGKQARAGIVRDSVNFIALQMTKGDTATITSDYAAVVPALLHINALADNGPENPVLKCSYDRFGGTWPTMKNGNAGHMFKYAQQAINKDFTHSVAYNDTLDILPFVETHFTYIGAKSAWTSYDQKMDAETFRKLGLKYVFSIVDYEDGNHATGESRHISIEPEENAAADFGYDKVNLIPRSVYYDKDGKSFSEQYLSRKATREAIDREPLIKVEIVDPNSNVLEVGYIKLLITDNYKQYAFDLTIYDDYWMNCTAEGGIKWSQVEDEILHQLAEGAGYTKNQFEAEYEIDLIKGTTNAKRFVKGPDGKFVADANPVGDVYYTEPTPQDDPKDKQTNVIKWAIGSDYATIAKQITGKNSVEEARAALLENKGDGIETMFTTIRFVKKGVDDKYKDMTALYVTLNIPGPQVHFAYGEITKKDLAHWYKLNSYKSGSETDYSAIDILENVPTPAENANVNLENDLSGGTRTDEFERPLYENFLNGMVNIDMGGKEKNFNKYVYTQNGKNINVDFEFTLPVKGVNAEFNHDKGTWKVRGISGREYTLSLGDNSKGEANKGIWDDCNPKTLIAQIIDGTDGEGNTVPFIRLEDNDCANDILNYAGRYDANGANMANESESDPFYLNNPDGDAANRQTFTTYLQIKTKDNPCYELLVKNPYFNAKFLRPINVWGSYYEWNDAFNAVQTLYPSDLLSAKDWRDYTITLDIDKNFKEGEIGWDYYNIFALSIDYNEIYTDHAAEKSVRDAIAAGFKSIPVSKLFTNNKGQLNKVSEIPSLKNPYLRILALDNSLKTYNSAGKIIGTKAPQTPLEYTNNGGNVQDFHLFVPVYVQYAWGHNLNHYKGAPNTFKVWTVIKVHQTTGAGSAEAKKY
jgi:hypothetical protein